jgi:hypothetical protein
VTTYKYEPWFNILNRCKANFISVSFLWWWLQGTQICKAAHAIWTTWRFLNWEQLIRPKEIKMPVAESERTYILWHKLSCEFITAYSGCCEEAVAYIDTRGNSWPPREDTGTKTRPRLVEAYSSAVLGPGSDRGTAGLPSHWVEYMSTAQWCPDAGPKQERVQVN